MHTIYVDIIILEMLLAVVELQQLPLLLLLTLHIHKKVVRGLLLLLLFVIVCLMTHFVAVFFAPDFSVFFY